jgi:dihydroorotate dehydrogenase electron transfer subunit
MGANQFTATVLVNTNLCRDHYRLILKSPSFPPTRPGQFIQISCRALSPSPGTPGEGWGGGLSGNARFPCADILPEPREFDWSPGSHISVSDPELAEPTAVLRRPFSLAGRRGQEIDIIHRVVGLGTHYLATLNPGDEIDILGPLGNTFTLPAPGQFAIMVGGGVGIPPMIYLASQLAGTPAVAFAGSVTRDLMPLTPGSTQFDTTEFSAFNVPTILATDDGSLGFRGFVTQALEEFLDGRLAPQIPRVGSPILYTCGPEPMMKRVADIALRRNLPCQVAVERAMACGMGTCQSCCIRVKKPDPARPPLPGSDWCYRLTCTDGPIFQAAQLLW